ncbi:M15 family metallopeptidase [Microbacterium sp.]|uniref:M15 family metallopeptidase n=1 Tax=Microbacterium sp. TaxID=51671 RepID=UPI0028112F77|nr:M15 family metallopeptidase [Microbacterium sp.]
MSATHSRHASRAPLAVKVALPIGVLFTAVASLATLGDVFATSSAYTELPAPAAAMTLPVVQATGERAADPCGEAEVRDALAAGDDAAAVAAFGGGEEFRAAVTAGNAPCISLQDPNRSWVVINKQRPLRPETFEPGALTRVSLQSTTPSNRLRPEAAEALARMAAAARDAGVGVIGINNGYRSFGVQQLTYSSHVRSQGQERADAGSARPGFSEHQTGFAIDVVACDSGCTGIGAFGDTAQGRWVAEHAWEYGFIVRYEHGETGTTGYLPEPWHLRYIGTDLAAAYHDGDFRTLEEFFALPAASDYDF